MMLARVADSLYWMGRYVERAEHMCRLGEVMFNATLDQSDSAAEVAAIALAAVGRPAEPAWVASPVEAVRDLVFDQSEHGSVVFALAQARENARQIRDQITTEMWDHLNVLYLDITGPGAKDAFEHGTSSFLQRIVAGVHLFKGAAEATMIHGESWRFLALGSFLERAQLIARLLDVTFGEEAHPGASRDHLVQVSLLRMACALEPYLRTYTSDLHPKLILEFLLLNEEFPRSIRFATARIEQHSRALSNRTDGPRGVRPERLAGRLSSLLQFADPAELAATGAADILRTVTTECDRIHEAIHDSFVAYPIEQRLPA